MSQIDFNTFCYLREGFLSQLKKYRNKYNLSWSQMSDLFGYEGESTMRNIVNGYSNLNPYNLLQGLRQISREGHLDLHRFAIDSVMWIIIPRMQDKRLMHSPEITSLLHEAAEDIEKADKVENEELMYQGIYKIKRALSASMRRGENMSAKLRE